MTIDFRDLRVLVCTANLGNARPDEASIAAMIPDNGCFTEVVNDPHYPLPTPEEQQALMEEIGFAKARSSVSSSSRPANSSSGTSASQTLPNIPGQQQEVNMSIEPGDDFFDIIVIGLQEATFEVSDHDAVSISVVSPLFLKTFNRAVDSMTKSRDYTKEKHGIPEWLSAGDSRVIGDLLYQRCPSYNFSVRYQRGEMRLEILTHRSLTVETLSVKAQNTGIGVNGIMNAANKGGIVAELLVENSTRLTFCTAHLQAHEGKEKYRDRCRMTSAILEGTAPDSPLNVDLALRSHVTFFLGDLNFRTELPDSAYFTKEHHIKQVMKLVQKKKWRALNLADELFRALRDRHCLVSFKTLPCFFPPTFKLERNGALDYKDQRRPSYTDRILWRTLHKMEDSVKALVYEPIVAFSTSDHKPVRGAFQIQLNEYIEPRAPLANKRLMTMSVRNLFALPTHRMDGTRDSKLHLFFSKIQCFIKKRAMAPEPYVVFMSFPHALVQQKVKRFQKIANKFRQKLADETVVGNASMPKLDSYGFPRTKRRKATYTPEWRNETSVTVATHDKEGKPLDMTGAILFLVVMDKAPTIEKSLLGIFPLNLAHLCMSTAADASLWPQQSQNNERSSWFLDAFTSSKPNVTIPEPADNRLIIMKQPLMRNGKEKGWISISLDSKWLSNNKVAAEKNLRASATRKAAISMRRSGERAQSEPMRSPRNSSPLPSLGTSSRYSPHSSPRPSLTSNGEAR